MSGRKQREHYARWDGPSTELLIREIVINREVRQKMKSLIDKHHLKIKTKSVHLKYGLVKELTQKIHLAKEDSRAISIKMINIAKSFGKKPGLERLFQSGWKLADKLAEEEAQKKPKNYSLAPATDLAGGLSENRRLLESILKSINLKVQTFTRLSSHRKIQKGAKNPAQGRTTRETCLRPTKSKIDIKIPENGGDLEIRSTPEHPSQSLALELENDQLSRISNIGSSFCQGPPSPRSEPEPATLPSDPALEPIEDQFSIIYQLLQELRLSCPVPEDRVLFEFIFQKHLKLLEGHHGKDALIQSYNSKIIRSFRHLLDRIRKA